VRHDRFIRQRPIFVFFVANPIPTMSLSYQHVYEPGTDPSAPPLLLLHGTGGDEHDLIPLARRLSPGSALLSPRGDVLEHGAPRFFRRFAEGVFDLDDVRRRTHALADFIAAASRQYGFDPRRLTAVGFSNGANIAASLLLLRPEAIADAILLRAMLVLDQPAAAGSLGGRRILLANGQQDPIVPLDHPARLAGLLEAGGAAVTRHLAPAGHSLTAGDLAAAAAFLTR
jgi:phospholipase/carboxylesterase